MKIANNADSGGRYRWRPFVSWGRHQFRVGLHRERRDRVSPEYRFLALEWQL